MCRSKSLDTLPHILTLTLVDITLISHSNRFISSAMYIFVWTRFRILEGAMLRGVDFFSAELKSQIDDFLKNISTSHADVFLSLILAWL